MRILMCDDQKIDYFYLPNEIKEFYSINYYYTESSNCEILSLYANNNMWTLDMNINMQIISDNKKYKTVFLKEYSSYTLYFADLNKYVDLFVLPDLENFLEVSVNNFNVINISNTNDGKTNIFYHASLYYSIHVVIQNNNGVYVIKNLNPSNNLIYINGRCIVSRQLNLGDVIFINGLKIIWMGNYFLINDLGDKYNLFGLNLIQTNKIKSIDYTPITEVERNTKIFNENQIFFHTPRIQSKIKKEKIKIDAPPNSEMGQQIPMLVSLGSTMVMGLTSGFTLVSTINNMARDNGENRVENIVQLLTGIAMLVSSLIIPFIIAKVEKKQAEKNEKQRVDLYTKYLDEKVEEINKIIKHQEAVLHESNLTLKEIQKRIANKSEGLWYREISDEDFLTVRLGIGNLPAEIEVSEVDKKFEIGVDELRNRLYEICDKKFETVDVPICISMTENRILPFIFNVNYKQEYINSIILQLIFYYSPMDLKIVFLTNKLNEYKWDYIKYLPHCWSKNGEKRLFATNEEDMVQISIYLEQLYNKRLESNETVTPDEMKTMYKKFTEYYLIITDDFKVVKKLPIVNRIIEDESNFGFSMLIFENNLKNLPSKLNKFVDIENNFCAIYSKENDYQIKFTPEIQEPINIRKYSTIIANIPVLIKEDENSNLPTALNFLEMYNAGRVDHLNILQRWKDNDPTISLNAQLGIRADKRPIGLDLHEKFHGPHGLIAGTTGSGKSEFIITYVLSMAINYSPYEVQFVLIDYKGGGLAGAFENREKGIKIPHLIGTITNLDTSEMNRSLVSINSEMKRRQRKFNEARDLLGEGTIDIYKYQKLYREGKVKEPIAHLFIICDEFAELKQQQPEFMEELISTSRIGRSLGVHLILATQKPSGVVDDQIWSNSKFKICLKVQSVEDSKEMLKKEDAAYIKESGRFYLQVGNDEIYELGQSGWAGAKYVPTERLIAKLDDSIDFISDDGDIIKSINDEIKQLDNEDHGEQLTNIVSNLYSLAIKENYKFNSLWLPSISGEIFISDLIKKYQYKIEKNEYWAIIGEYDKPAKQFQGLYYLDLKSKNTVIWGMPNSGKENLVYDIIYTLSLYYSPQQINVYILDFGSESLRIFSKLPMVGDFITSTENEKIDVLFQYLQKEIRRRKDLLSEYAGSFDEYCKNSGNVLPLIIVVLNAYDSFAENASDYDDTLSRILREGAKCGIVFITTVVSTGIIRSSVLDCYSNKIVMQINDPIDYKMLLNAPPGLEPKRLFGRGITIIDEEACEFQSAYISDKENINVVVRETGRQLFNHFKYKVPELKALPSVIKLEKMMKFAKDLTKIPLGYTRNQVELEYYDFTKNKCNLVIGKAVTTEISMMCSIIDLIDSIPNISFNIFDFISCIDTDGNAKYYNMRFEEPFNELINYNSEQYQVNVFIGMSSIESNLEENELNLFNSIMNNVNNFTNQTFIIFDDFDKLKKLENLSWYSNIDKNSGIWVGDGIDEQEILVINDLKDYDIDEELRPLLYVITNNNYEVVKGIGESEGADLFEL